MVLCVYLWFGHVGHFEPNGCRWFCTSHTIGACASWSLQTKFRSFPHGHLRGRGRGPRHQSLNDGYRCGNETPFNCTVSLEISKPNQHVMSRRPIKNDLVASNANSRLTVSFLVMLLLLPNLRQGHQSQYLNILRLLIERLQALVGAVSPCHTQLLQ